MTKTAEEKQLHKTLIETLTEALTWQTEDEILIDEAVTLINACITAHHFFRDKDKAGMLLWVSNPMSCVTVAETELMAACAEWAAS